MDFNLQAGAGFYSGSDSDGLHLNFALTYRISVIEVGGFAETGGEPFGESFSGVGATAGVAWRSPVGLRLSLAGSFGQHSYTGVGSPGWDDGPGVDGNTLFVGARAGASWIFGPGPVHFELGLAVAVEHDVTKESVPYSSIHDPVYMGETHLISIGTTLVPVSLLRLGITCDAL
ncbi:hypothetical protein BE21_03285 [Sorangium cellulosum]|uniref:Outer membrane protein beta-barrel domain-containing protein n=1 Tax=Sorangium cellulosum TaxID=56 RepID=A0A150TNI7_SORCE|nr:hypothetical protein BE21_03285 [Sorangium cellulosum]